MVLTVAATLSLKDEALQNLKDEIIEKLRNSSRFEEAGDLISVSANFDLALDCYLKANNY